jgi:glucosyl-dolichyl phosphate glucuronosyltransferase
MDITVAICTWNRADLLDLTLRHMRQLRIPRDVEWELLVVNNNCSDHTDEVIAHHLNELPIRRILERKKGKANAANSAIGVARGELILWTDDDVLVDSEWIAEYVQASKTWRDVHFFGGTVDPLFAIEPPRWISENLRHIRSVYAILQLGFDTRLLRVGQIPFGANMAIRTEVLRQFQFNPQLGPNQENQVRGEESDLLNRMMSEGYRGLWVGSAKVRHFIPAERLSSRFLWDWYRGSGRTIMRMNGDHNCPYLFGVPRWAVRKYVESRLISLVYSPIKNLRWLEAFRDAALMRGILDEAWEKRQSGTRDWKPNPVTLCGARQEE